MRKNRLPEKARTMSRTSLGQHIAFGMPWPIMITRPSWRASTILFGVSTQNQTFIMDKRFETQLLS
jgi:hypothetical protein